MTLPQSDLYEEVVRRQVRQGPGEHWLALIDRILLGEEKEWLEIERTYPHATGWLFQYAKEAARKNINRQNEQGAKAPTSFSTTQIFTPRWVADRLCEISIVSPLQSVHDPAMGAGQFLLAAYDRLKELGAQPCQAAALISGSDLDPEVLRIARFGLRTRFLEDGVQMAPRIYEADLLTSTWSAELTITNPPFLGRRALGKDLRPLLDDHRPFHFDLFATTLRRAMLADSERIAMILPQSFWFLERFREARKVVLGDYALSHFFLMGPDTFLGLSGQKSASAVFSLIKKQPHANPTKTHFYDLRPYKRERKNEIAKGQGVEKLVDEVTNVPGGGLAFFLEDCLRESFRRFPPLSSIAEVVGSGNKTADNKRYLRMRSELEATKIRRVEELGSEGAEDSRWVPYAKGGKFAPWWGNWDYVVDWSPEARHFYATNRSSNLLGEKYWFRKGLTYSDLSSVALGVRRLPEGTLFDMTGPAIFVENDDQRFLDGLMVILNSTALRKIVQAINPTLHIQVGDLRKVPIPAEEVLRFSDYGARLAVLVQTILCEPSEDLLRSYLNLEREADEEVCKLYGFRPQNEDMFKHHSLRSVFMTSPNKSVY